MNKRQKKKIWKAILLKGRGYVYPRVLAQIRAKYPPKVGANALWVGCHSHFPCLCTVTALQKESTPEHTWYPGVAAVLFDGDDEECAVPLESLVQTGALMEIG